jgi:hypothetical protein
MNRLTDLRGQLLPRRIIMVCPNDIQRQRLETLYQQSPSIPIQARVTAAVGRMAQAVAQQITRDRNEPQISKDYTVDGKIFWSIYDPVTRQRLTAESEQKVRQWLERRHLD